MSSERNAELVLGGRHSNRHINGREYHRCNNNSFSRRINWRDNNDSFSHRGVSFGVSRSNTPNFEVNFRPRRSVYSGSFVHRFRNRPNRYSAQRNDSSVSSILVEILGDEYDDLTFNPQFPEGL